MFRPPSAFPGFAAFAFALTSTIATPAASQAPKPSPEAVSLFGAPLEPPAPAADAAARLLDDLARAEAAYAASPTADALIWVGRRQAYLGRYREAIATFSKGVTAFPKDARFYRHRGHRYITTRQFENAAADLERAVALVRGQPDEVEPDGQPNALNIPTSTLQFNIWYHLGLAEYLRGRFDAARTAYAACLDVSRNPDAQAATRHWLYMTLRRLKQDEAARALLEPVSPQGVVTPAGQTVIENASYHRLLLMYKGELTPKALVAQSNAALDRTTVTYGLATWHSYNGRPDQAVALLRSIVHGPQWAAFGSVAAEADLTRLGSTP